MNYAQSINAVMSQAKRDGAILLGEINSYRFPDLELGDFPVCENLMNAVGVGIALTGQKCIVSHDRMDFVAMGLDPIINFAAIGEKTGDLPLVLRVIVGHGKAQGPQHAKDLSHVFSGMTVHDPKPEDAAETLKEAIDSGKFSVFVERREHYERPV